MNPTQADWAALIGRIFMALLFLIGGINWAINGLTGPITGATAAGMPLANIAVTIGMVIQIVGAAMIIAGFYTRLGALAIFVFTALAIVFFHRFWEKAGPAAAGDQVQFFKDLALCGGMLYIMAFGPGRISVDARRAR